ncbi:MAG: amino acid ABC transporter permease, partial [Paracoccaceae bacterium]
MKNLSYVRTEMLPQQAAPLGERGLVKWARENLFSGPLNTIATLLALYVAYLGISAVLPWLLNGVWNANSLAECREIITASAGEGASGACWALIRERWHQWLFGFYPQDQYWRPTLAFILLFVAIAPVLFNRLPKALLWFTLLYPALCFWLLWGGSVWGPIVAMIGFVVLAVVYRIAQPIIGVSAAAGAGVVAAVLWWLFLDAPAVAALSGIADISLRAVRSTDFGGFLLAITIGVTAI